MEDMAKVQEEVQLDMFQEVVIPVEVKTINGLVVTQLPLFK